MGKQAAREPFVRPAYVTKLPVKLDEENQYSSRRRGSGGEVLTSYREHLRAQFHPRTQFLLKVDLLSFDMHTGPLVQPSRAG